VRQWIGRQAALHRAASLLEEDDDQTGKLGQLFMGRLVGCDGWAEQTGKFPFFLLQLFLLSVLLF
jgi:hypothetical protein